jgi:hypothetical protein
MPQVSILFMKPTTENSSEAIPVKKNPSSRIAMNRNEQWEQ